MKFNENNSKSLALLEKLEKNGDHNRETGYAYSDQMTVIMGKTTLYDRESGPAPKASQ
jgi:hypothetical protein